MDAYRMIYTGSVAAMLPGLGAGTFGLPGFLLALLLAAAIVVAYQGIRAGLKEFVWYRWFFSLIFGSTLVFGAVSLALPEHKGWVGLAWLLGQLFVLGGYYPYFEGYHPPGNERIPRG